MVDAVVEGSGDFDHWVVVHRKFLFLVLEHKRLEPVR